MEKMDKIEKLTNCFASLSVLFMCGTLVGSVMLGTQFNDGDVSGRLGTMNPTEDFVTIPGGCMINSSEWSLHSFSYSQEKCSSQCYHARACSERWNYYITLPGGNTTRSAPEDHLLSTWESCKNIDVPQTPTAASTFTANTNVPCWRAVHPSAITRNERLPQDPRTSSYDGLTTCRSKCSRVVGYACGNEACVTVVDPAEQYSYYEDYINPNRARNVGIVLGFALGTILTCVMGYWTNKKAIENVEKVGPMGENQEGESRSMHTNTR